MTFTIHAALLAGSLIALPVTAQTPPTTSTPQPAQEPPVPGPRIGSPDLVPLGPGVMGPRLIKEVKPKYPESAAGLTGIVTMQAVVLPDGTVGDVQFSKDAPAKGIPAGRYPDIDKEAIRTVRQWRFVPARRDGEPVPVMVEIEMLFAPTTVAK